MTDVSFDIPEWIIEEVAREEKVPTSDLAARALLLYVTLDNPDEILAESWNGDLDV